MHLTVLLGLFVCHLFAFFAFGLSDSEWRAERYSSDRHISATLCCILTICTCYAKLIFQFCRFGSVDSVSFSPILLSARPLNR
jgi:hypothetical protein